MGSGISRGREWIDERYLVAWPDGIVKVGCTGNGRRRWGPFLSRGAVMLDRTFYPNPGEFAVHGETRLEKAMNRRWNRAFNYDQKALAIPYLGKGGCGYLECFRVPGADWPELMELARSVT